MTEAPLSREELRSASPGALQQFLEKSGWVRERQDEIAGIWSTARARVLVPLDTELADYAQRMLEALQIIREVEPDRWHEALATLLATRSDVLRFRSLVETPVDGSVRLDAGVEFIEAVRHAVIAAAKASGESKLPYYANRNYQLAQHYLESARLGQTEKGSYIVTVIPRLTIPEVAGADEEPELFANLSRSVPPERQVNILLMDSLNAAQDAAGRYSTSSDFDVFREAVGVGVSAELCDAAVGLLELGSDVELSLSVASEVPSPDDFVDRVILETSNIGALQAASREFRTAKPEAGVRVVGVVERLNRQDSTGPGTVGLKVLDGTDAAKKVRLRLEAPDYDRAIEAHRQGLVVRVRGSLEREGNLFWLYSASDFLVGEPALQRPDADDQPSFDL